MAEHHWAWQFGKLSSALGVLITSHSDVRNRVFSAAEHLLQVSPDAIPPPCQEDMRWIHHMLTRYPQGPYDDSRLTATFRRTRNVTAGKIASRVWRVYSIYDSVLEDRNLQRQLKQAKEEPRI
jgi:hypothetical protein